MKDNYNLSDLSLSDRRLIMDNVYAYAQSYISKWDSTSRLKYAKLVLPKPDTSTILKGGEFVLTDTREDNVAEYLSVVFKYHNKQVTELGYQQGLSIMLLKYYNGCVIRKSHDGRLIVTKPELVYDQSTYRKQRKTKDGRPRFENNRNEFEVDRYK